MGRSGQAVGAGRAKDKGGGPQGNAGLALQMYGSQEDGSIDEDALSSILKTALGVAELSVTDLFRAIDQEEKGRITFGEALGAGRMAHLYRKWGAHLEPLPTCARQAPCASRNMEILTRKVLP